MCETDNVCKYEKLIGKIIKTIDMSEDKESLLFRFDDDLVYRMYHEQNCCESVYR